MTNQLISIQQKASKELSKLQKQFNSYSSQVETLKKKLSQTQEILEKAHQQVGTEIIPLELKKISVKTEILWVLDRQHDSGYLKKRECDQLAQFIVSQAYPLIEHYDKAELKPLIEKYANLSFEELHQDHTQQPDEPLSIDEDAGNRHTESFHWKTDNPEMQQEDHQTYRQKTAKQLAKEEKLRQEAKNISRTVQNVYRQLVKEFHPDLEQNSIEKERKTHIMQRITEAYQNDDLFELLRLQLEYNQKDSGDFAILPDEQLRYYNKLLKEQIHELEGELQELQTGPNALQPSFYQLFCHPPERLDATIKREVKLLKKELKALEAEKKALAHPENVRYLLKDYRLMY